MVNNKDVIYPWGQSICPDPTNYYMDICSKPDYETQSEATGEEYKGPTKLLR